MEVQNLIKDLNSASIQMIWDGGDFILNVPHAISLTKETTELINKHWDEIEYRIRGPALQWRLEGTNIVKLFEGDCFEVMKTMPENLVDLIATDPPYGFYLMGKNWDKAVPSVNIWKECLRVLKPGGWALIMSSPRQDLLFQMFSNLRSAGFDIGFSSLYWAYATGFPKAHKIRKGSKKEDGVDPLEGLYAGYQPKPAVEVIIMAQKPLSEKTYAKQAEFNEKGGTWLDDCRIPYSDSEGDSPPENMKGEDGKNQSRFPANLITNDDILDDGKTHEGGYYPSKRGDSEYCGLSGLTSQRTGKIKDKGGFSKYFSLERWADNLPFIIVPKARKREKEFGCEDIIPQQIDQSRNDPNAVGCNNPRNRGGKKSKNFHPTVKPIILMSYLITMGSREGDLVFDPFCGSATTCLSARLLKRASIGIEKDPDYFNIAATRMKYLNLQSHIKREVKDGEPEIFEILG